MNKIVWSKLLNVYPSPPLRKAVMCLSKFIDHYKSIAFIRVCKLNMLYTTYF